MNEAGLHGFSSVPKRALMTIILACSTWICKGQNQLTADLGYRFKPYQFTPYVWLAYTTGSEVKTGFVAFHNFDRIRSKWPNEGVYKQLKNHFGFGLCLYYNLGYEKRSFYMETALGLQHYAWKIRSKSDFLRNAVIPREDEQWKMFYQFSLGYRYKLNDQWEVGLLGGVGLNNIKLEITRTL